MKDNDLRRRAGYLRNLEYNLDKLYEDVEAQQANKWVDESDDACLNKVLALINGALATTRFHYSGVLGFLASTQNMEAENEQLF